MNKRKILSILTSVFFIIVAVISLLSVQDTPTKENAANNMEQQQAKSSEKYVFTSPEDVRDKLLNEDWHINIEDLERAVPENKENEFIPSKTIEEGYKYNYQTNGMKLQIKWHSPDANAKKRFPDSNSGNMWTAQITVNDKLLAQDGKYYTRPNNQTHIPVDFGVEKQ